MEFRGNLVALVTPFRQGGVDREAFARLLDRAVAGGVSALVPCGTTGESPTLTHGEHDALIGLTVELAEGRVPVVAGTGSNSTAEAIRLTRAAAKVGAAAALVVTPYYNRPSQAGLLAHFRAVADCSELPVALYDIPGRTGVALGLDTIAALAEHPNIRAVKEASGQVENVTRIRNATGLAVLSGDDALSLPMIALGATGVVSVLSNVLPRPVTRLVDSALAGDFDGARAIHDRLHPLMRALFVETNPVPVKAALAALDLIGPELRLPLAPLSPANREHLLAVLDRYRDELSVAHE